jgi:hypothetical protein
VTQRQQASPALLSCCCTRACPSAPTLPPCRPRRWACLTSTSSPPTWWAAAASLAQTHQGQGLLRPPASRSDAGDAPAAAPAEAGPLAEPRQFPQAAAGQLAMAHTRPPADPVARHPGAQINFKAPAAYDRAVSVEMFEHMKNYQELLRRVGCGACLPLLPACLRCPPALPSCAACLPCRCCAALPACAVCAACLQALAARCLPGPRSAG